MIFLILIILVNILLLSKLNFLPYPELFVYPYLTNHGLVPYRDILDQHFPGLMFFPINLGSLGMNTPQDARLWQYGTVAIIHILLFLVGKQIFKSNLKSIIPNLLFLIWQPYFEGWVLWIDSFLPIFTLTSLYFLKVKRIFWTGFFLGLALLFKQIILPLIVLVGIYILFKEKKFRSLVIFGLGVALPVTFLFLYITNLGIWKDFIFWTITFNLTTFAEMGRKFGTFSQWARVIGVYGFAIFSLFSGKYKDDVILIGIFLVGSMTSIYARFDFVHLQPSLPFVALLSTISIFWLFKQKNLKMIIVLYILASIFLLSQFFKGHVGDRVLFFGSTENKVVAEIQKLSRPGEKIFTLGTLPHIYQLADRLPPGNIFVFQFPWFMIEAEDRILEAVIKDSPRVVIRDLTSEVEGHKLISFMPKINKYIEDKYKTVDMIENIEIMIIK